MNSLYVEKTFTSDMQAGKDTLDGILSFVSENLPGLSCGGLNEIKLIFSELIFNAIIHGNSLDCSKEVYISIEIKDNTIYSTIRDDGIGFNHKALLFGEGDDMSEHGRGVKLACTLTDSLMFNVKGNEVKFCKKVCFDA